MTRTAKLPAAALLALTAFVLSDTSAGQDPTVFQSETKLVLVRFQMIPKKGQSADLLPEDVELTEDGTVQRVALVQGGPQNPLTSPVEINLLFGAVPADWADPDAQALDLSALKEHPNVSIAVWAMGEKLIRLTPPTRDSRALNRAVAQAWQGLRGMANSAPSISSYIAVLARAAAQGRTNVIRTLVVSPGKCSGRNKTVEDAMEAVRQAGITVFSQAPYTGSVPLTASKANPDGRPPVDVSGGSAKGIMSTQVASSTADSPCNIPGLLSSQPDDFLDRIAKATGGRTLSRDESLPVTFSAFVAWLGDQILHDYVIGFYPAIAGEPKAHKIRVRLKDPRQGQITGYVETVAH